MKLQSRYTSIVIALIAIIILVLSSSQFFQFSTITKDMTRTSVDTMTDQLQKEMQERGISSVRFLSVHLGNALYSYDMEEMENVLSATKRFPNVEEVYIYNDKLEIVHDGSEGVDNYGKNVLSIIGAANPWKASDAGYQMNENDLISYQPIYIGEDLIGGVGLVLSMEQMQASVLSMHNLLHTKAKHGLRNTAYMVAVTAGILILIGLVITFPIAKTLVDPIVKLRYFADQVGKGNYNADLHLERNDELGELASAFEEMSDNLRKTNNEMKYIAYHDELTGLSNRRLFREHLERELTRLERNIGCLALLYIDLDDFKRINDTLGHDIGDLLLKEAAHRIVQTIRTSDCAGVGLSEGEESIARIGGDEFMVLLSSINKAADAAIVCTRIIERLSQPFDIDNNELIIGTSIGVTIAPLDGTNAETLIKNADMAMYQAKGNGKDQYQFYSEALNIAVLKKFSTEADLRTAVAQEQFILFYQPKVRSSSGEIISMEALIRWHHPEKGWISPAGFIPIAEETGCIVPIGKWVIEECCRQLANWRSEGIEGISIALNVSSIQFQRQSVPNVLRENMEKYNISREMLQVEVTETALMSSEKEAISQLEELAAMGIYLWLDDFGTGFSSLSYLRQLPINGIKIDRSFVMEIEKKQSDKDLVAAIVVMAKTLKLDVIAEGIETKEQLEFLLSQGCDYAQGYYFHKPLPVKELTPLLGEKVV